MEDCSRVKILPHFFLKVFKKAPIMSSPVATKRHHPPEYVSTFTPDGQMETDKLCSHCHRLLAPSQFRMTHTVRQGVSGIVRNSKCRKCESLSNERYLSKNLEQRLTAIETEIAASREESASAILLLMRYLDAQMERLHPAS